MDDGTVVGIASGQPKKWKSKDEQIEWLVEYAGLTRELYAEQAQIRLLEVKALHMANARNKHAVKSNQQRFRDRDAMIRTRDHEIAALRAESDELRALLTPYAYSTTMEAHEWRDHERRSQEACER